MKSLDGYKTYLVAIALAILTAAEYLGVISPETYQTFLGLLGALGLYAVRDAIHKAE